MEGLVLHYSQQLKDAQNIGIFLTKYYCELFGINFNGSMVGQFQKLVKLYGRDLVFKAITDVGSSTDSSIDHKRIYGLINFICKKNIDKAQVSSSSDLSSYVEELDYRLSRLKGKDYDIRSPFDA